MPSGSHAVAGTRGPVMKTKQGYLSRVLPPVASSGSGRTRKESKSRKTLYGFPALHLSGRRESNPRPSPWEGDALPLSYSRMVHH